MAPKVTADDDEERDPDEPPAAEDATMVPEELPSWDLGGTQLAELCEFPDAEDAPPLELPKELFTLLVLGSPCEEDETSTPGREDDQTVLDDVLPMADVLPMNDVLASPELAPIEVQDEDASKALVEWEIEEREELPSSTVFCPEPVESSSSVGATQDANAKTAAAMIPVRCERRDVMGMCLLLEGLPESAVRIIYPQSCCPGQPARGGISTWGRIRIVLL